MSRTWDATEPLVADTNWGRLPDGWDYVEVAGVGVDVADNVYVFNRGEHPVIVFDREGNFLRSWGEGVFSRPHGLHVGHDGMVYCTDEGDHTVRKCTPEGRVLLEIGLPNQPSPHMSGLPFNRCTHTALSPEGDIYVSDGYGNACVHKYAQEGKHLFSWGAPGIEPGNFNVAHNIVCDDLGIVYVADRENHRVQRFDGNGRYLGQWNNIHRPCALCATRGSNPVFIVGELGPSMPVNVRTPNLGLRVSVLDQDGNTIERFGKGVPGRGPEHFIAPHGIAVDSRGTIYVGEVAAAAWPRYNPGTPKPDDLVLLRRLLRKT
ncbi:peptidyl-alpha-hydroxyglycine alpha-amidating lyase family protein [Arvimicrobium flavum]|uniref:peptidyl-alpha-hydroxyglycine alpha-amidating lyase family protein n=1 Tax=Arvimicrobium flavum TaxID=3393320 RepID=UPI00237A7939|nr:peptidyl-alpha-hydroxyglycine alpha-amidating lyase family protein [Mesorhizobium shangrilense]